jgi:LysM repeat protein
VKPGDTLYKIAARVNRNARAIAAENKIALDAVLRAGTLLLIPKQ